MPDNNKNLKKKGNPLYRGPTSFLGYETWRAFIYVSHVSCRLFEKKQYSFYERHKTKHKRNRGKDYAHVCLMSIISRMCNRKDFVSYAVRCHGFFVRNIEQNQAESLILISDIRSVMTVGESK